MLLPSSEKLVGIKTSLVLVHNSEIVKTDNSSASGPRDFELKLRKLLEYDDLSVEIEFDKLQSGSGLRTIQWSIAYTY